MYANGKNSSFKTSHGQTFHWNLDDNLKWKFVKNNVKRCHEHVQTNDQPMPKARFETMFKHWPKSVQSNVQPCSAPSTFNQCPKYVQPMPKVCSTNATRMIKPMFKHCQNMFNQFSTNALFKHVKWIQNACLTEVSIRSNQRSNKPCTCLNQCRIDA